MASVIERLRKRQFCPVDIGGEIVHVRGLTWAEWEQIEPIRQTEESNGAAIGLCLLDDDRKPIFQRAENEDLKTFGARVLNELDMEVGVGLMLAEKIIKVTQEPKDFGQIVKN